MKKSDTKFIEGIKGRLVWNDNSTMPLAKERIIAIYTDGTIGHDYAINMALFWSLVSKWVYFSEVIKKRTIQQEASI